MTYEDLVILVQVWDKWRIMTAHLLEEDTTLDHDDDDDDDNRAYYI